MEVPVGIMGGEGGGGGVAMGVWVGIGTRRWKNSRTFCVKGKLSTKLLLRPCFLLFLCLHANGPFRT